MSDKCPFCGAKVKEESQNGLLWFECLTTEELTELDEKIYDRHEDCYNHQIANLKALLVQAGEILRPATTTDFYYFDVLNKMESQAIVLLPKIKEATK